MTLVMLHFIALTEEKRVLLVALHSGLNPSLLFPSEFMMKFSSLWISCLLLVAPLQVPASSLNVALDKTGDKAGSAYSQFSVQENTQIPGATLKPGSYNIRIVDHLSDRMVLRVERDGKAQSTFLGAAGKRAEQLRTHPFQRWCRRQIRAQGLCLY